MQMQKPIENNRPLLNANGLSVRWGIVLVALLQAGFRVPSQVQTGLNAVNNGAVCAIVQIWCDAVSFSLKRVCTNFFTTADYGSGVGDIIRLK